MSNILVVIQVYSTIELLSTITGMVFEFKVDNLDVSLQGSLKLRIQIVQKKIKNSKNCQTFKKVVKNSKKI